LSYASNGGAKSSPRALLAQSKTEATSFTSLILST